MRSIRNLLAMTVILMVSASTFAADFSGVYKFVSRYKGNTPDMQGWWGTMVIVNGTMSRIYHSPDAKTEKYYVGPMTEEGGFQVVKFSYAYKPEYIGNAHKNKMVLEGGNLTMTSDDGKFKEIWLKK